MNRRGRIIYGVFTVLFVGLTAGLPLLALTRSPSGPEPLYNPQGPGWTRVGQSQVQTTCDHGHRIYFSQPGLRSVSVSVSDDPTCAGGGK